VRFNRVEDWSWPWPHWVVRPGEWPALSDELVRGAYNEVPPKDWPGWTASYDNDCERGKRTTSKVADVGPFTDSLFRLLNHTDFVQCLAELTGVQGLQADPLLHGAGLHVTEPGGHLSPHLDYALHPKLGLERRLNLVLFLNPDWRVEWGGAFELWDDEARKVESRIVPEIGKMVLWTPGDLSYHSTQKVGADCPHCRVSAATYYLAPPRSTAVRRRALFVPNRGEM
jgi:hypothetical protein